MTFLRNPVLGAAVAMWAVGVAGGMAWLWDYSAAGGDVDDAPLEWPRESAMAREPGRHTLVVFAHPQCPCSEATASELAELVEKAPRDSLSVHVQLMVPEGVGPEFRRSRLVEKLRSIDGVRVHWDELGAEAARFHALTSGLTVLYGDDGKLRFEGGLTMSRGHVGESEGRRAVLAMLGGQEAAGRTDVFGCPLDHIHPVTTEKTP